MTIRTKITLSFSVLTTLLLLLTAISVYYISDAERKSFFKHRLSGRVHNAAQLYILFGDSSQNLMHKVDANIARFYSSKSIHIYSVPHHKRLYGFNENAREDFVPKESLLNEIEKKLTVSFKIGFRDAYGLYFNDGKNKFITVVAAYDEAGQHWMKTMKGILMISLFAGIILSIAVGHIFSRQLLKPLSSIIDEVTTISSHNLSHHINAGNGQDELHKLASTFNNLLSRLQESFTVQRRFISNASHELSTPLTSISSQVEITLQKDRSEEEYRSVLQSIQEDVQQLRVLTRSLLEIAKAGDQGSLELNEVRVDEALLKVTAAVKKLSDKYQVQLHFDEFPDDEKSWLVFGNADLLVSAIKNIVENGCKYSVDQTCRVSLHFNTSTILIDVRNKGEVIPKEEYSNIFLPFYRAAGNNSEKGFGLGLALARRIINIHRGSIEVHSDQEQGTLFRLQLPATNRFS